MSLEQELMRNTEALVALTAAIVHSFPVIETTTKVVKAKAVPVEVKEAEVPKPAAAVVTAPAVSTPSAPAAMLESPAATAPLTTSPASVTSAITPTIEYAQVAAAIVATFKVDRVKVIDALSRFGAAKGPQLRPEDYAEFLAMLEDAPA